MRLTLGLLTATLVLCGGCRKSAEEAPPVSTKDEAEGYYLKATNEFLQGNFDAALAAYEEVRKRVPDDPRLPAATGEVLISQGKWMEARLQFQEAVRLDPKRATNWSRLAYVQSAQGELEAASTSLNKALQLNPADFNAMELQAELLEKDGKREEAAAMLVSASASAPDYRQGDYLLQAYRLLAAAGKPAEARALLMKATSSGAKSAELHALLGELQIRELDFEGAARSYAKAAELAPVTKKADGGMSGDSTYWEILGRLNVRLDKLAEAEKAYRQAARIERRAVIHVALAKLAFLKGDEAAAKSELDRALTVATGEEIRETLELADLLSEVGRKPDALKLLEAHASAEDGAKDVELQLKTAGLAAELKQTELVRAACKRAFALDAGVIGCP